MKFEEDLDDYSFSSDDFYNDGFDEKPDNSSDLFYNEDMESFVENYERFSAEQNF